ncbi:MAG: xanthine dehydrogenase family protein molybdopterin-binding subunit, partial [Chloroflexi bacterium]|nr:xanthine dehydrogenase family protein molybdopterin-binding subunit [Chloroflexota bacterium]
MVLVNETYNVVGTRPIRHDAYDKVTGRALYGADYDIAGLIHGKILRSPHAHAMIRSIDTSKAEAAPGVLAVVTGNDLPESDGDRGLKYRRANILANGKALYAGQAVAAVAAFTSQEAEDAVSLIEVDYEVLPPVLTALAGMKGDAPLLHDDLMTEEIGVITDTASNLADHFQHRLGDIALGFGNADVIVEGEYNLQTVHQGYIEPQPCVVLWNQDGRIHIWCSTQGAFLVRDRTAEILGLPVSQIKVTPLEIGGGFGGKTEIYLEPVAALLSKKTGRPVKMVMTRKEVFEGTGPAAGGYVRVKMGATKEGKLTAAQAYLAYEAGAFPGSLVGAGAMTVFASYDIPNVLIDGFDVVVNKPHTAAYRPPGAPQAAFATEQAVDELAKKLDLDPLEFRLRNAAREGSRRADGPVFRRVGCVEVIEAMMAHPHYQSDLQGANQGRGVAIGFWFNIGEPSSCTISVNDDGTVNLIEGSTDIGGSRTSIAMQAAEVLGLRSEEVIPTVVDTDSIGYTAQTDGSRTTFATGWAAYEAAQDVKRQMILRVATIWEVESEAIELSDRVFSSKADPELKMTFKELASRLTKTGGPIVGSGTVNPSGIGGSFAGGIADVEVDPQTGKVDIVRYTAFQDAGKAVHPTYVEGQLQGGAVQGFGWGLNEAYVYDDRG